MHQHTDEKIWLLCLSGNMKAFEELYKRFYPLLYNYGNKFISKRETAHDLVQDFFIKLITNRNTLSPVKEPKTYLIKSFRNNIYNVLLRTENNIHIPFSDQFENAISETEIAIDTNEHIKIMLDAYKTLSSKQKEIIYLYFVRNLSHEEISCILSINYQSSKNLLCRSLGALRQLFFKKIKNL